MKTGHTPSRSVPEYWENTTIPWFTLADVWQLRNGQQVYLGETANKISTLGLENSAADLLPVGTVVLSPHRFGWILRRDARAHGN